MRVANALSRNLEVWWRTKNNHEPVRDSSKERQSDRCRGRPTAANRQPAGVESGHQIYGRIGYLHQSTSRVVSVGVSLRTGRGHW